MSENYSLSDQQIIDCLNTDYGIEIIALVCLPLVADMNTVVYKAVTKDNLSYFVKLRPKVNQDINVSIIELLDTNYIQQIILPIKTIHGQLNQDKKNFTMTVYPFIQGQNGFDRALTDEQWIILGKTLRQIHELDVPLALQTQLRQETFSPKWREIVRLFYNYLKNEPIGDEVAIKLHIFMNNNISAIYRLVDRAEQLAEKIKREHLKFVLCHSDIHAGNILISENNNRIYIVDWDEPIMAPKERDLMFIGGGVGNVWNNPDEEMVFYKGYGKTKINLAILAYYRHERIVEDMAIYAQQLLLTVEGNLSDRMKIYQYFIDMFKPKGVVEIAFYSDEKLNLSV